MVAPSITRWSAVQLTFIIWAFTTFPFSSNRGRICNKVMKIQKGRGQHQREYINKNCEPHVNSQIKWMKRSRIKKSISWGHFPVQHYFRVQSWWTNVNHIKHSAQAGDPVLQIKDEVNATSTCGELVCVCVECTNVERLDSISLATGSILMMGFSLSHDYHGKPVDI